MTLGTDLGWEGKRSGRLRAKGRGPAGLGKSGGAPHSQTLCSFPRHSGRAGSGAQRTLVGAVSPQPVVLGGLPRPLALGCPVEPTDHS